MTKKNKKAKRIKKVLYKKITPSPLSIREGGSFYRSALDVGCQRICSCGPTHINCLSAKQWLKNQIGVWQFTYESRDVRDRILHPATFPISLSKRVVELFTHKGELVLDPFVGSGTTLVAARDLDRNAIGFDLQKQYVDLCEKRLSQSTIFNSTKQIAVQDDARHISC